MAAIQRFASGTVTLSAGGAATLYFGPTGKTSVNEDPIQYGFLLRVVYTKVNFSDGVTFTFSGENTAEDKFLVTAGNGNASTIYHPQAASHVATTGAATAVVDSLIPIVGERLKLVIGSGGNATTGSFVVYVA